MNRKRTLLSVIVFLSVFWISNLFGSYASILKRAEEGTYENPPLNEDNNIDSQKSYEARLNALSNKYSVNIASISDRLYLHEDIDTDTSTDKDSDQADASNGAASDNKLIKSDSSSSQDEPETKDKNEDHIGQSDIIDHDEITDKVSIAVSEKEIVTSAYSDIGISIAKSYVNIRDQANTESEVKGKLYKGSAAKILEEIEGWYYIESGSVKGYVAKDYIKTGIPDDELIETFGKLRVSINAEGLNVREHADIDSKKLTVLYKNEIYHVIDLNDEWIKVDISDDGIKGYISREYVDLLVDFDKAISKEEEEKLNKLEEEKKSKKETEVKQREELDYSKEDLKLLACLVHAEAGDQSYEGKLAVANVVLNRKKSSKYPDTIKDVIYQPGQFTVAKSGSLAKQISKYDNYSSKSQLMSIKAAKAALSGSNNIGSRLYFNAYKSAVNKGYHKKKNAVKIEDQLFW